MMLDQLLRRVQGKKLKKPLVPLTTKSIEREYYRELKPIVEFLKKITVEKLISQIDSIKNSANLLRPTSDSFRTDAYPEDVELLLRDLRREYDDNFTDTDLASIATVVSNKTENFNAKQIDKNFQHVFGISPVSFEPYLEQELKFFVAQNVKLIKSLSNNHFEKLEQIVFRGVQQGRPTKDIIKEISNQFKINQNKARLIAHDQVSKFNGNLTKLRQKNTGIERYRWSTSGDERVRASHRRNNGKIFSWGKPPSTGHPGEDVQCRCVAIPIFSE